MKLSFSRMSFVKLPKTKRFEYTPRHYDEVKERIDKRKKEIAQEMGISEDGGQSEERVRREINFRAKMSDNIALSSRRKVAFWSNMRLIIILSVMLVVCYYIYKNLDTVIAEIAN